MQRVSIKTIYLILVISIGLVGLGVGSTFAMFTASSKIDNPISFTAGLAGVSDVIETIEVTVSAGSTKATNINVTNSTSNSLNYVMWYIDEGLDIELGSKRTDSGTYQSTIGAGEKHQYEVSIKNNSSSDVTVVIGVSSSSDDVTLSDSMVMVPQKELGDDSTALDSFEYILGGGTYKNDSDLSYSVPEGEIYLINYKGSSSEVNIPATYTVNGVKYSTVILSSDMDDANGVFTDNKKITSVSIDENVKLVNFSAGTATTGSADSMFSGCSNLTTISSLPNSISSIYAMFYNCTNLTGTIVINAENISKITDYTFKGTTKNIKISLPETTTTTYKTFTGYYSMPDNVTLTTTEMRNTYFSLNLANNTIISQQSVYSNTTWADFVNNSSWNTYGLYISTTNTIKDGNNWEVSPDGTYAVKSTDLIINGMHYTQVE